MVVDFHCHADIGVSHDILHYFHIKSLFRHSGTSGMPQGMSRNRRHTFRFPFFFFSLFRLLLIVSSHDIIKDIVDGARHKRPAVFAHKDEICTPFNLHIPRNPLQEILAFLGCKGFIDRITHGNLSDTCQVEEEDFFCHVTHKTWDVILHDIRKAHENDSESAPDTTPADELIREVQKAMQSPGDRVQQFTEIFCKAFRLKYKRLSQEERSLLKKLFKKSPLIKQSGMNFRRRPWK